ncbi:MAG: type IV secretion protein IcmC [Legionellaceae bacterium]|nr:type IV secretion protein IcmC [Legionellaceae bacterium]
MASSDLVVMFGNLSRSLPSVDRLLGGLSYLLGLMFYYVSITKFRDIIEESGGQKVKIIVPSAYFLAGSALFFLPTVIDAFSQTLFGSGYNVLAYSSDNMSNIYSSITMLIQMAGFIWFMRGCVLLAHASHPEQGQEGSKGHGPKGFLFIVASLFAINIQFTVNMLNYFITHLMSISSMLTS